MSTGPKRVTLTKPQLATAEGRQLRELLARVASDGALEDAEIAELSQWLTKAEESFAGIAHLRDTLIDLLRDGIITDAERSLIFRQIERVLPKEDRETVQFARRKVVAATPAADEPEEWVAPTEAQRRYIIGLGGNLAPHASRADASAAIDLLLNTNASITPRQRMVLRFWRVDPQPEWGRRHVSEWMDGFYAEDSDRQTAWELFKEESGDYGTARDPERVPIGAGESYLARVKQGASTSGFAPAPTAAKVEDNENQLGSTLTLIVLCLAALVIFAFIFSAR